MGEIEARWRRDGAEIGVITPYNAQVLKLREELHDEREAAAAAGGGLLEVGTVDGFQGPIFPLYLPDTSAISPVYLPRWARWTGSRAGRRRRSSSRWCEIWGDLGEIRGDVGEIWMRSNPSHSPGPHQVRSNPISPLSLPNISRTSPLCLHYISPISPNQVRSNPRRSVGFLCEPRL